MEYDVSRVDPGYRFTVHGASFIGAPRNGTVLFVTRKVRRLLDNLRDAENCLVFAETGLDIPEAYRQHNCFVMADDPQLTYATFALEMQKEERIRESARQWTLTPERYWLGENVTMGAGCVIEAGCRIGHDVILGDGARIGFGSSIYHARIGDDFGCLDRTSVGIDAYFMAEGDPPFRIPSFGSVIVGNHVDLSSNVIIERGFNSDTYIGDNTKIDSNVCIGHDVRMEGNISITCGASIAGLVNIGKDVYIGMNAAVKQRLSIGEGAMVGMGAVVVSNVSAGAKVFGNPAVKFGIGE